MGNGDKKPTTTTTTPGFMQKIASAILPKSAQERIKKNKEAESYDDNSGNPCHYQTHVGDKQGMNRQGRTSKMTCHHRKS